MISVYQVAGDSLSRIKWSFTSCEKWGEFAIILVGYEIERRSGKGRFRKAQVEDRWFSSDERRYNSGLSRPVYIPQEIIAEVKRSIPIKVYIGWCNNESEYSHDQG